MNIIKTKIKPVGPNVIPGAQYHVYAPIVSPNQAGLAKFDKIHFTVDEYGIVRFNDSYIAEKVACVRLNPEKTDDNNFVTQTIQSNIDVAGTIKAFGLNVNTAIVAKISVNSPRGDFTTLQAIDAAVENSLYVENEIECKGEASFEKSVEVGGDLRVKGTTYTVSQETIMVDDNLLVLNSSGDDFSNAGFVVKLSDMLNDLHGDYQAYGVVYDPSDDTLKLGFGYLKGEPHTEGKKYELDLAGNFQPIATRVDFDVNYDNAIPKWSHNKKSFIPSSLTFKVLGDDYYDEELLFTNHYSRQIIVTDHLRAGASIQTGSRLDLGLIPKAYGLRDGSSILGSGTKYIGTADTVKSGLRCHTRGWDLQVSGADTIADGKFNYVSSSLAYMYGLGYDDTHRYNAMAVDFSGNLHIGNKIYVYEKDRRDAKSNSDVRGADYTTVKYQVLTKSSADIAYIRGLFAGSTLSWHTTKPSTNDWVLSRITLSLGFSFTSNGVSDDYWSNTFATTLTKLNSYTSSTFSIEQAFERNIDTPSDILYVHIIKIMARYLYNSNGLTNIKLYGIHDAGCVDLSYLNAEIKVVNIEYLY